MRTGPAGEAMPPEGRGTDIASDSESMETLDWSEAERRLNRGGYCWLATIRPDGAPHVMPVLAVWSESVVFVSSKDTTRKSRNLAADGRCVLTTDAGAAHLIVEGEARRVRDRATLDRASQTFEEVHGWPTTVTGQQLDADYGAPTSGGPPYGVYAMTPTKAFALPSEGTFMPTRWRFPSDQQQRGGNLK